MTRRLHDLAFIAILVLLGLPSLQTTCAILCGPPAQSRGHQGHEDAHCAGDAVSAENEVRLSSRELHDCGHADTPGLIAVPVERLAQAPADANGRSIAVVGSNWNPALRTTPSATGPPPGSPPPPLAQLTRVVIRV